MNYDYLYAVQEHSIFMSSHTFMVEKLTVPGGLLEWTGCYLTQYFFYPWLGSGILILIWVASFLLTIKVFDLKGVWIVLGLVPVCALMCSITDLGYWLYYINDQAYWFEQSVGYLVMIITLWGMKGIDTFCQRNTTRTAAKVAYIIVLTSLGYVACGWWALLGAIVMMLTRSSKGILWERIAIVVTGLLCIGLVPWIAYQMYSQFRIEDAWWVGLPLFQHLDYTDWEKSMPFFVIAAWCIFLGCIGKKWMAREAWTRKSTCFVAGFISIGICTMICLKNNFSDENFHSELRLYKAVDECRWQDVIDEFEKHQSSPTHQMVMCKNIALINLGQLGEKTFALNNIGTTPNCGKLKVRMIVTAGSLLYYYNGLVNFAYRWAMENEVNHCQSLKQLKMMARCAIWKEENDLAEKYLTMLRSTTFHKKWAQERERMRMDLGAFIDSPEYHAVAPLELSGEGELDVDNGLCMEYIINNYAYLIAQNMMQQEAAVCYAMILKDDDLIKFQLENYYANHSVENVPKHIVEAVDIFNQQHSMEFNKFVSDYQTTLGDGGKIVEIGKMLKPVYGKTYWWYYYFFNDFNIY